MLMLGFSVLHPVMSVTTHCKVKLASPVSRVVAILIIFGLSFFSLLTPPPFLLLWPCPTQFEDEML